jgi:hypothetical protein
LRSTMTKCVLAAALANSAARNNVISCTSAAEGVFPINSTLVVPSAWRLEIANSLTAQPPRAYHHPACQDVCGRHNLRSLFCPKRAPPTRLSGEPPSARIRAIYAYCPRSRPGLTASDRTCKMSVKPFYA